tara:strand:+ start:330 stop:746 length:417 start_codon:yes stop_codon:yes gene_type:complete
MVVPDHLCLYGLKSKDLLEREGHEVDDHHLTTREETDTFKAKYDVKTTPQTFIGNERIGGYDDLSAHFGNGPKKQDATTYQLVITLFSVVALMAIAVTYLTSETVLFGRTIECFISIAMILLGLQKNFRTSKNSQRCF